MGSKRYIEEFGEGKQTLVAVHGLGGSVNSWYPQSQVLNRDFRVVLYDLAGAGRSPLLDGITMTSHVEDLLEVVTEVAGGPVHLAGHSMGTIICQHFAVLYPELVLSLCLAGAFQQPPEAGRAALQARAEKVRTEGMRGIADAIVAGGTSKDTRINSPAVASFVRESLLAQNAEGYARNCEALSAATAADPARILCETLLLTGDEDRTAPPETGRVLASSIPKAQLHILAGCGHWTTVERAKQVNYEMSVFYARLNRASPAGA